MSGLGHGGSLEVTIFSLQSSEMCSNPDFSVQAVEKTKLEEGPFQNNVKSAKVQLVNFARIIARIFSGN